ncbi:MAG: GAF domain-containing protein, partial [Candidatus Binatia bacterium]
MSNADTLITGFSDAAVPPDNALPRHSELHTLQEIGRSILDSRDLNIIMEGILNKAFDIGRFDIGMICFVTAARQTLEPIAHRGFRDPENLSRYGEHIRERSTAGVVDRVLATKEIRVVNLDNTAGIRTFRREGVRSLVIVPLRADEDALGIVYLGCREPREFDPAQIRLLEAVGTQTGIAVQKIRLLEAAERHAREQEALNLIAMATSQSLDPKELLEIAAEKTVEVTGRQRINFRLKDPLTGKGNIVAYRGFTAEEIEALRRIVPHAASDQVFASGDPLVINDSGEQRVAGILPVTQSVAWIPIKAGLKVVGVLGISDDQSRRFSRNEVELLRAIGNVIGVAIENARLFEQTSKQAAELEKANKDLKRREEIQTLVKELNEDVIRLNIDPLLKKLTEKIREILRVDISDVRVLIEGQWKL